ncbi:MAG: permease-like cell division protein FtsX [Oscillospiraceae bacterium]|jgi:cell division transport system permease protein|nr:permease-like cell division protein FtsX [Oscillospiraceae bacterium]
MKLHSLWYLLGQGIKNVWVNQLLSIASVGVLTVCFLLIGVATLFSYNLQSFAHGVEKKNEVVVFVGDGMAPSVAVNLKKIKNVASFVFVSKETALKEQLSQLDEGGALFEELGQNNPLPDSYRVALHDVDIVNKTIKKIGTITGVEKVNSPTEVAKVITTIKNTVSYAGVFIVGFLLLVSLFIIATTIEMTIYNRRREINIMKFVGASNAFIRVPFVVEGMVLGIVSAFLAYAVLHLGYVYMFDVMAKFEIDVLPMIRENIVPFAELGTYLLAGFLCSGPIIGMFGSVFFVRKHLKV